MFIEAPNFATMRETRTDEPMAVPPSRAIAQAARQLTRILQTHGPHAIGFCVSESLSAETHYVVSRFARGSLRTAQLLHDAVEAKAAVARGEIHAIWLVGGHPQDDFVPSADVVIVQDDIPSTVPADIFFPSMRGDALGSSQTKPDWWWIQQVARAMGFNAGLQFASTAEIHNKIIALTF